MNVTGSLNVEDGEFLCNPIERNEIGEVIKAVSPHKSPGLDGFDAYF